MNWKEYLKSFPINLTMYHAGHLPESLLSKLKDAIEKAPKIEYGPESSDYAEVVVLRNQEEIALLNRDHSYRDLDFYTKAALGEIFRVIKDEVAKFLGTPWRVLNVRSWTTKRGAEIGPNSWHTDGDLDGILKMMIYATPTGGEYGGLEYAGGALYGESWIVFYNSILRHRGIAPSKDGIERVATEITLCPAKEFQLEPVFLGLSARKPLQP